MKRTALARNVQKEGAIRRQTADDASAVIFIVCVASHSTPDGAGVAAARIELTAHLIALRARLIALMMRMDS